MYSVNGSNKRTAFTEASVEMLFMLLRSSDSPDVMDNAKKELYRRGISEKREDEFLHIPKIQNESEHYR